MAVKMSYLRLYTNFRSCQNTKVFFTVTIDIAMIIVDRQGFVMPWMNTLTDVIPGPGLVQEDV